MLGTRLGQTQPDYAVGTLAEPSEVQPAQCGADGHADCGTPSPADGRNNCACHSDKRYESFDPAI
ncbi:MAG TPA: hypothetical protein VHE81_16050 [Lacipirellulaceae bacterium]|nr:hypothetical protein [Lacipirellulaceae bacterium]